PGNGASGRDDGAAERDHAWRHGHQRQLVHRGEPADDRELHPHQRSGGNQRDRQWHEFHRRHLGDVQRGGRDLHRDFQHGDPGDRARGRHDRSAQRHHAGWHGHQRQRVRRAEPADDRELLAWQRSGGDQRDHQWHQLHRRHVGVVQRGGRDLHGNLRHGDPGNGASGRDDGSGQRDYARRDGHQRQLVHGSERADHRGPLAHDRSGGDERYDQRHQLQRGHGGGLQRDQRDLHGDLRYGDPGDGAGGRDDGSGQRDYARRDGHQRQLVHRAEPADHRELRARQRSGGDQRDDQRHELQRGHGGGLQRGERDLYGHLQHGDPGDRPRGCHYGSAERHHAGWHGHQRQRVRRAAPADDRELRAWQRPGGDQRDDQRHELQRGHGGDLQWRQRELRGHFRHGNPGDGAGGRDDRPAQGHHAGWHGHQRQLVHGGEASDDPELVPRQRAR